MTDHGPEVDPLGEVDVHPAATIFPLITGEEFEALMEDIREHDLHEAIVFTPDGRLLDGRNRWRACRKLGLTPITRVEVSDPWAYVISANVHRRHLTDGQRSMIAARLATRHAGQRSIGPPGLADLPPRVDDMAVMLKVGSSSIGRAKEVLNAGTEAMIEAVDAGLIPVGTAARVARDVGVDEQDQFVRHVREGANPVHLATTMGARSQWAEKRDRGGPKPISTRMGHRHSYITANAINALLHSLDALSMVEKGAEGLDPALTRDEADRWLADLAKGLRSVARVRRLLTERRDSTS